jgi:hypothetical protein
MFARDPAHTTSHHTQQRAPRMHSARHELILEKQRAKHTAARAHQQTTLRSKWLSFPSFL